MSDQEQRIANIMPTAGALVCAVADRDRAAIGDLLTRLQLDDLYALAITLAASVDVDSPLLSPMLPMSEGAIVEHAINETARRYGVPVDAILSTSRERAVLEARQVAMAVCRMAGLSSPVVGRAFERDHSTVLYAATRVGENAKLRRIARSISEPLCPARGVLGDELDGDEVAA